MAGAQLNRGVTKGQGRIVRGRAEAAHPESRAKANNNKNNREQKESMRSEEKHRVKGKHEMGDVTCHRR